MILLQFSAVCSRAVVVSFSPCFRYQLDEVVVSLLIFCQYYQVVSALVFFAVFVEQPAACHVHLATDDGLEQFFLQLRQPVPAVRQFGLCVSVPLFTGLGSTFQGGDAFLQVLYLAVCPAVLLVYVVEELLDAEHISMVSDGHSAHSVGHSLVNKALDAGLSVQYRVVRVHV